MKQILIIAILFLSLTAYTQNYNFNGTISRNTLQLYLEHGMNMGLLVDEYSSQNAPLSTANLIDFNNDVAMISDINVRLVGRTAGLWGWERRIRAGYFNDVKRVVDIINNKYREENLINPICEAAIFEIVSIGLVDQRDVNDPEYHIDRIIPIPNDVAYAFDYPLGKYFDFREIKNDDINTNSPYEHWVDISKVQAQMWYYYLSTRYIDAGIECLSFNQTKTTGINDPSGTIFYNLISKIKTYATNRNRGIVLTAGDPLKKQGTDLLVFDFHRYPIRMHNIYPNWGTGNGGPCIIERDDVSNCSLGSVYGEKFAGITSFGWDTEDIFKVVEFDNYGNHSTVNTFIPCGIWGYDEINWFEAQTENYRSNWLKYAFYRVKCLDESVFLEMPGRRSGFRIYNSTKNINTVKNIWNHIYDQPNEWVYHNFTDLKVYNPNNPPNAITSLVFVGTDKIFYIADDGYIHGYYYDNGAWKTVSPSYSAQSNYGQSVGNQVKAHSNLVASPDGTKIIYKGIDNYLHGFDVNTGWNYSYFDLPQISTEYVASGSRSVIFGQNDAIYYRAYDAAGGPNWLRPWSYRVHALIYDNGNWVPTSPSWVAQGYGSSVPINQQKEVAGDLAINPQKNQIIYRGTDGQIYGYDILNKWDYSYYNFPTIINPIISGFCYSSDDRFFYIENDGTIHGRIFNGSTWVTTSPTYASQIPASVQVKASDNLAISPDGNLLAYIGTDNQIHCFKILNDWAFYYFDLNASSAEASITTLNFRNNNELQYISSDKKVHLYEYHQPYCKNVSNDDIFEPNKNVPKNIPNESSENVDVAKKIKVYPNPVTDIVHIAFNDPNSSYTVRITNAMGQIMGKYIDVSNQISIDLTDFSPGMYFVEVINETLKINHREKLLKL